MTALLASLQGGCASERPDEFGTRVCRVTWKALGEDVVAAGADAGVPIAAVGPELLRRCSGCHGGASPAAGYDVSRYLTTLKEASGKVVAVAGDPSSLLLQTIDPQTADPTHQAATDPALFAAVQKWVVDCQLAIAPTPVHPAGWANPDSVDFHARAVPTLSYDLGLCQKCHGDDFKGGAAKGSCFQCHDKGPTDCETCHGQPPATGAHQTHVKGGAFARPFDCGECHVKPMAWTDVGHVFDADGGVIPAYDADGGVAGPPAGVDIVPFGAFAGQSFSSVPRQGPPGWDQTARKCSFVYCHGGAFGDENAKNDSPRWNGGSGEATCGSCHGLPPSNHKLTTCWTCHPKVAAPPTPGATVPTLVDLSRHVDGKISLGDESGTCWACHGSPNHPSPPRDLQGRTDPGLISVGAHDAHLGAHRLRGPVACGDCHAVPTRVTDPGHIDHDLPAQLFPAAIASTSLAFKDGAQPAFDHDAGTCSRVYCHGGGAKIGTDQTSTLNHSPLWTGGGPQAECGACHGIPPQNAAHAPGAKWKAIAFQSGLQHCADCHPQTIDSHGDILITGAAGMESSTHINGTIDVAP